MNEILNINWSIVGSILVAFSIRGTVRIISHIVETYLEARR
jgi:hypothetical protein